jgi:AAA ATPase domain
MWPIDRPPQWVDRSQELGALRAGVEALRHGGGTAVLVEGEPGIGKSSLVAEALAGTSELDRDVGWGFAGQLGVHSRHQAVEQARALGLLAPSGRKA